MKSIINYIFEKQNFLVKGHTTGQKSGIIPSNNDYFTDGTASEDLVNNAFQHDTATQWSETHKGEIIEYTTTYFKECIKNKTNLTPEEFASDYISYLEQYFDEIPKKEKQSLATQFISLIEEEC